MSRRSITVVGALGAIAIAVASFAWHYRALTAPMVIDRSVSVHHDDFDFRVVQVKPSQTGGRRVYDIDVDVANNAKRVDYRWAPDIAYAIDEREVRFRADPEASSPAATIAPHTSLIVHLRFVLPEDAVNARLAFWDGILMGDFFDGARYARLRIPLD